MATSADDSARMHRVESGQRTLFVVETDEQNESLRHPIRAHILRVLCAGMNDYETEVTSERQTLGDGTGLTHSVEVRRPIQRYWMAVQEIAEGIAQSHTGHKITSNQCYYHLQKLEKQGLVEHDPPLRFDDRGERRRTRGLRFRSAARFFVYHGPRVSGESPCFEFLQNGWGLETSEEERGQLKQLILDQEQTLFGVFEHLASHMIGSPVDSVTFSVLLDRLAHVFLSDNDAFRERYRDAKRILVRSGWGHLDSERNLPRPVGTDDVRKEEIRGNIDE